MQFRSLGLLILLFSTMTYAQGRKPAVEDFVGIEVEHPEQTPPGTEALFNFEKEITQYEDTLSQKEETQPQTTNQNLQEPTPMNWPVTFGFAFIVGLPLVSWLFVMSHLRRKATEASATNIRVFEDYKRERQAASKKAQDEEVRKVS